MQQLLNVHYKERKGKVPSSLKKAQNPVPERVCPKAREKKMTLDIKYECFPFLVCFYEDDMLPSLP
jgi:hypothetical protein